ncbi:MAG TPA: PmoA family protein [Pirellulales bacterium]|nr:PmoA family protein [Pirellulales bacterium]
MRVADDAASGDNPETIQNLLGAFVMHLCQYKVRALSSLVGLILAGGIAMQSSAAEFTVDKTADGVTVNLDGKLFTKYEIQSGKKPILWPIIGPTGKPMTRPWPMDTAAVDAEKTAKGGKLPKGDILSDDHSWHRSLWFSYQSVNGNNLWEEHANPPTGSTKHKEFVQVSGGPTAKIVTRNDWLDPNGKKLLEDERTITCMTDGDNRIIDFDITLKATEGDVVFGDEKDGVFGLRVPDTMRVDAKQGGSFVNNEGKVGEDENPDDFPKGATGDPKCKRAVWGNRASWVDYHGPVEGEKLGIAILEHPTSFGYPTRWHTRDYGLFAANVFGQHVFDEMLPKASTTLKAGDTMKFYFRVIFHKGDEKEGHIAEAFAKYAAEKP